MVRGLRSCLIAFFLSTNRVIFLQNDNAVGWDELPAAGMASGAGLNQRVTTLFHPKNHC